MKLIIRVLAITGLVLCLIELGSSQVTLSKGWGPGKRAFEENNCRVVTKSVFAVCRTLMSELRQLMACETRGMMAYAHPGEPWLANSIVLPSER